MAETSILLEQRGGVALVTIDRAERRNALSRTAWIELGATLSALRQDPDVVGMILTGAGDRAFAAGADLSELADRPPIVALDGLVQGIVREVEDLPFPTIAAMNGHALGGGWELALACDLRVLVSTARVGFPEVSLGILPGAGGTSRLLHHVGLGLAKEWILTGTLLSADEALQHGLVNRVVEPGTAVEEARTMLNPIVAQPKLSVRLAKLLLDATARGASGSELERLAYALTFHAPDRSERMHRFLEDRDRRGGA